MGDVKRMKIRGADYIEREYVPAEDYDAIRTRLAEVELERDGAKERLSARVMVAVRSSEATYVIKCMRCENCGEELGEPDDG